MNTYEIHEYSGRKYSCVEFKEPEVGQWYCGFERDYFKSYTDTFGFGVEPDRDGAIAQYLGDGIFYDDQADKETDMGDYDFLVKQG